VKRPQAASSRARCSTFSTFEILRLQYAETLRCWRRRFQDNHARIAKLYDERFCRMWEFYLTGAELMFRRLGGMVFQIQMAKRWDGVPLTRDYITDWELAQTAQAVAAE
jgi:cyclopropane-fatty-acyl-phospholipid synthase